MNSKNDYIRQYLGVDKFHAAGYTGKRTKVLTGEEKTVDHGANTRLAFLEIAPDAEIAYAPFPTDGGTAERFHALRGDACCMFVSLSGACPDRKLTDAAIPDDLFLCVSAGNEGEDESNHMMRPEKVYGVGAVEVCWSAMRNGKPKDGATAIVEAADYSSTSDHVDFAAPTELYLSGIKKFNGTSCACPVLVGMAALVNDFFIHKTGKPLTHAAMYRFLHDHCVDVEVQGKDGKTGYGVPILPEPSEIDVEKYCFGGSDMDYKNFCSLMARYESEKGKETEPDWSKKEGAWKKAYDLGIMDGQRPNSYVKRSEFAAVLDRLGLIKKKD